MFGYEFSEPRTYYSELDYEDQTLIIEDRGNYVAVGHYGWSSPHHYLVGDSRHPDGGWHRDYVRIECTYCAYSMLEAMWFVFFDKREEERYFEEMQEKFPVPW